MEQRAGRARSKPAKPDGSEEPAGYRGGASAQGKAYTWQDGDRTLRVRLQLDLVVLDDGAGVSKDDLVARTGAGPIADRRAKGAAGRRRWPGVPLRFGCADDAAGGVLLALDPQWDTGTAHAFLARNGIKLDRVSELGYLTNGFFVETASGLASLHLANALAGQAGVHLSSPNWWRERTTK